MSATLLLLIPLVAAVAMISMPAQQAKWIALVGTLATFVLSVIVAVGFNHWTDGGFGLQTTMEAMPQFGITLHLGADSVSMWLILLTTLLMPLCVWGSFTAITDRLKEYYGWLLVIETAMIGVFLARDIIFFYVCFELTLVPMFFLIAIYGGQNKSIASLKFFIFTFTGSLITLAGVVYVAWAYAEANALVDAGVKTLQWSFDIPTLTQFAAAMSPSQQAWVLLALMAGFAVKVPLFPVHTWLPLAHTDAPTAGSVVLAGVLLKLGTYGLYRFVLPMVPAGLLHKVSCNVLFLHVEFLPIHLIAVFAIIGILYAALICWVQSDIKKLVAYSSVSHLGFCVLGLFALNPLGVQGSVLYMLNHGLSTGALFFLVGMIYERYHTRDMDKLGGLARRMPVWSFFMVFFVLSSVGLPGLNGFVSEFLCLIGAFTATSDNTAYPGVLGPWYAAFAGVGMILAAMYLLIMVGKVVFGPLKEPGGHGHGHGHHAEGALPADLSLREIGVLVPLAVLCVYIGFQPAKLTDTLAKPIEQILAAYPAQVIEHHRATGSSHALQSNQPSMDLTLNAGAAVDG